MWHAGPARKLTWRVGPARKLTWRAGPTCECDAAVRPRGRAARGPREAQVAQIHGSRPRGSTRTPVRGAAWQSGGR